MLHRLSLALLVIGIAATQARADDGIYVNASFAYGFPSVKSATPIEADLVSASHVRSSLGYRIGKWAIEPTLSLSSVDTHDYQMHTTTQVYDYALGGAQVKYFLQPGTSTWYVRGGANRAWSQASIDRGPAMHGVGLDAGFGFQLSQSQGSLAGGFFADVGYEATWLGPRDRDDDRITCWFMSLGFGAGTGY